MRDCACGIPWDKSQPLAEVLRQDHDSGVTIVAVARLTTTDRTPDVRRRAYVAHPPHLALELAPVRVNLIAAGFVDTPLSASLLGDQRENRRNQLRATLPIRRVVGPADVAALAVHIMTNTALTGATYDIDGGQQLVAA